MWKSEVFHEIKWEFFQSIAASVLLYYCTTWNLTKCIKKNLHGNYTRILSGVLIQSCKALIQPLTTHLTKHSNAGQDLLGTAVEVRTNSWTTTHRHNRFGRTAKIYIHQLCVDTGCCLKDLQER